jgi:hypothetical protein
VSIAEDLAYKKIIKRSNVTGLKNVRKYLFKSKCKWKNNFSKLHLTFEVIKEYKYKARKGLERRIKVLQVVVMVVF